MTLRLRAIVAVSSALIAPTCALLPSNAAERGAWFQSLRQPGTGKSCCDISNCAHVEAGWHNGSWWALIDKLWRQVPDNVVLRTPKTLDGEAYACTGYNPNWAAGQRFVPIPYFYCFVPPAPGS